LFAFTFVFLFAFTFVFLFAFTFAFLFALAFAFLFALPLTLERELLRALLEPDLARAGAPKRSRLVVRARRILIILIMSGLLV
jgi:hypothetical protein